MRRVRALRDHGQSRKHVHDEIGDNARLASIQAGTLRLKLPHLEAWNARRRAIANVYRNAIPRGPLVPVRERTDGVWSTHQFVVRASDRERWRRALLACGVETGVHYPVPIHLQPAFRRFGGGPGSLPHAESLANDVFSLPVFPELSEDEIAHVVDALERVRTSMAGAGATRAASLA